MRQDHLARVALCFGLAAAACGGDDEAKVEVTLEFPSESAANRTATVHLWVVYPNGRDPEVVPTCNMLVAEEITPYDLNLAVKYDGVVNYPIDEGGLTATEVDSGTGFVYVEAVDFGGGAHLAGCFEVSLDGGTTQATIVLRQPGTYDCADQAVDNGEPCDDGDFCTVNEECRSGDCVNGIERDCSALSDVCNTATCTPGVGCEVEPLPDLTTCATSDFCTVSAVCMEGVCEGNERDCSGEVPECYAGVCDEANNMCDAIPISDASCDDGVFCTGNDNCESGECVGSAIVMEGMSCDDGNACTRNTDCTSGDCPGSSGTFIDNDADGDGPESCAEDPICTGGLCQDCNDNQKNEDPDSLEATGELNKDGDPSCTDGFDNDCDGLTDAEETVDCA